VVSQPANKHKQNVVLWVLAALSMTLWLTSWGLSSPVGSSPDDNFHLSSIWCAQGEKEGFCQTLPGEENAKYVPYLAWHSSCFAGNSDTPALCSQELMRPTDELALSTHGNFDSLYPAGFYVSMSLLATENVTESVVMMRLANVLLFVGLTFSILLLSSQQFRQPIAGAIILTFIPLGSFLIPSTNPSSWGLISISLLWIALIGYLTSHGKRAIALGIIAGTLSIIGASSRADIALMVIFSGVISVVAATLIKSFSWSKLMLPIGISIMSVALFAATKQSSVTVNGLSDSDGDRGFSGVGLLIANIVQVPELIVGALGFYNLGWLDTPMPALVYFATFFCFSAVILWSLGTAQFSKKWSRAITALLILTFIALISYPLIVLQQTGALVGTYFQPRYLLPLATLFMGVILLRAQFVKKLSFTQISLIFVLVSAANSLALYTNMKRYTHGLTSSEWNLDQEPTWWWDTAFSPMFIWALGTVGFTIFAWFTLFVFFNRTTRAIKESNTISATASDLV